MVEIVGGDDGAKTAMPIAELPSTALQALYHHVTGKTENMSQSFNGNVLINSEDVDRLHQMVLDQVATHHVDFGPTVTVEIKHANHRMFHHSSWERYKRVIISDNDLTSEMTIKFEFVLDLQNTVGPQRCSVSILLDSALPVMNDDGFGSNKSLGFWMFFSREWMTAKVSIDFVDFMVARGFMGVVQEWFKALEPSPTPNLNRKLLDGYRVFSSVSGQMGRIGFAIFLAICIYRMRDSINIENVSYAVCVGYIVWSLYSIFRPIILDKLLERITANIVPSVLLLSSADKKCYNKIAKSIKSTRVTIIGMAGTVFLSLVVNLVSSYAYTYLTGH